MPSRGRLSEFPLADHAIVAHRVVPQAFDLVLSTTVDVFDCAIVVFSKNCVKDVNIVCVDNIRF